MSATPAATVLHQALDPSRLSKSSLCSRARVSRALFDDYLHSKKQPSWAQVERIVDAAGYCLSVSLVEQPRPVSDEYVAVMQMADELAGKRETLPVLRYPHRIWRFAISAER